MEIDVWLPSEAAFPDEGETRHAQTRRLVPLDVMLPDMHGAELVRLLRKALAPRPLPCIFVSANAMPEDVRATATAALDRYVTKPVDVRLLLSEIDAFLGGGAG